MEARPQGGRLRAVGTPSEYRIERVDMSKIGDTELDELARLRQEVAKERVPEDPPSPLAIIAQQLRANVPGQWRAPFVARDASGRAAGYGYTQRNLEDKDNAHIRWTEVAVAPPHRRRGLGRALLAKVVEACQGQGEDVLFVGQTNDRVPSGEALMKALGAHPGLPMKINQLDLAAVDRTRVSAWAKARPAGYRLVRIDDVVPDALVPTFIEASAGINDMPKGSIGFNDFTLTEPQIRQRESYFRQAGARWWLLIAVDESTGKGAGFTEVVFHPQNAHEIEQEGTAVSKDHRGHGLGLWMKAVMLERILAELPESRFIRTGNANVNSQMIRINEQLGFRYAWQSTLWQLPIADARRAVAAREEAKT